MKEKGYLYIQHISLSHSLKNIRGKKKLKKKRIRNHSNVVIMVYKLVIFYSQFCVSRHQLVAASHFDAKVGQLHLLVS